MLEIVKKTCLGLQQEFHAHLLWQWEERYGVVFSEFRTDKQAMVRETLGRHLGREWPGTEIAMAPGTIQSLANSLGGMREGQKLLISDPEQERMVFCAWWPWGSGETVTIRLGVYGHSMPRREQEEIGSWLRSEFCWP